MGTPVDGGSAVWTDIRFAIAADSNVLITGADCAARFAVARLIYEAGQRRAGPFAVLGPVQSMDQLMKAVAHLECARAAGATLYIPEAAALSRAVQAELMRLLTRPPTMERVAACRSTRIIAASAHNLLDRLASNNFDPDLFYRLNTIHVSLTQQLDLPAWLT
jgi:DNA-binding NtrC family response regulator